MTANIEKKYLLLTAVLVSLNPDCVAQNCEGDLKNIAVYEGSPASFQILNNSTTAVWHVYPSSIMADEIYKITNRDGEVVPEFVDTYAANKTNLIIFNSTVAPQGSMNYSTAGLYRFTNDDPNCVSAGRLVVIRSGPEITCNTCDPKSVQLSCSVVYANTKDSSITPIMTWKNDSGATVKRETPEPKAIDVNNPGLYSSVSQLSIAFNDTNTYECQFTFNKNVYTYSAAENASIFTASSFGNCSFAATTAPCPTTNYDTTTPEPYTISEVSSEPITTAALNCSGQSLPNTVAYFGVTATFPRLNNGQSVQWQIAPSTVVFGYPKAITNYDDNVTDAFAGSYAVNQSQLTIFSSTIAPQSSNPYSTAGLYILNYLDPNCTTAANLIVVVGKPSCDCDPGNKTDMKLICILRFAESVIQPCKAIFKWKNKGGQKVKEEEVCATQIDAYSKRSESQFSIASNDTATYTCHVSFGVPSAFPLDYVTQTPPDFTASCNATCA